MSVAQHYLVPAEANFLRKQEVKRSGRSQNHSMMRGGKV